MKRILLLSAIAVSQLSFATTQVPSVAVKAQPLSKSQIFNLVEPHTITRQQISDSGATTIANVLQNTAGVQLQDLYGDGSSVALSMRGFGDNAGANTLILLDGQPLTNPDMKASSFNLIPLANVERIEVMPASAGVLYGDEAVGGVVNIITRKPEKFHAHADVGWGSYNSYQYQAGMTDSWKNGFGFLFNAKHHQSDNYRQHNDTRNDNVFAKLNYKYTSGEVSLDYQYINEDLQFAGALTDAQVTQNRRQAQNFINFNDENMNDFNLAWMQELTPTWKFHFNASSHQMQGDGVLTTRFTENRRVYQWSPTISGVIADKYLTTFGTQFSAANYDLDGVGYFSRAGQQKQALFGQFVIPLPKSFSLTLGARGAQAQQQTKTGVFQASDNNKVGVTDVALNWKYQKHLTIYARRDGNYSFPKTDEEALTLNNQPLKTQTGVSYELGSSWQDKIRDFSLSLYRLDLKNEILFLPSVDGTTLGTNQNLSPTTRWGAIFNSSYLFYKIWRVGLNYNYVDAKFSSGDNKNKRIPFVSENTVKLSSDLTFYKKWDWYAEALMSGNRYPASDVSNQGKLLGGYTIYNMSLKYHFKYATLAATVDNLTAKNYYSYAQAEQTTNGVDTYFYPAPERSFWLSVSMQL